MLNPIDKPIEPQKSKQWHRNIHPFFTKQAGNVVGDYIENFSVKNDLILDPFCGTGVTAIEALLRRRRVIVLDINPFALFITKQTIIPVDLDKLSNEFYKIKDSLGNYINSLFDLSDNEIENVEINYWYPKDVKLPSNSDFRLVEELFDKRQLISFSILLNAIKNIKDEIIRNQMLLIFSATLARANLTYNLSKTRGDNKLGDGGSSIFAQYRYWKPKTKIVLNVWDRFEWRFNNLFSNKKKWNDNIKDYYEEEKTITYRKYSATNLTDIIENNSIDYIYTDPPYGAHISYLDLSTMWNAWLGFDITDDDRKSEVIEGGELEKSNDDYCDLLRKSIIEIGKILKKDKWLSIVFAHTDLRFWNTIVNSSANSGLQLINSVFQPTNNSSIHYKKNPIKILCSQRILNFRKTFEKNPVIFDSEIDIEKFILNSCERIIVENDGASLDELNQGIVSELLNNNLIDIALNKVKQIEPLLKNEGRFFLDIDNLWKIKPEKSNLLGNFIPIEKRIRYYVRSYLARKKSGTFDEITNAVYSNLTNGNTPSNQQVLEVLKNLAYPDSNNKTWIYKGDSPEYDQLIISETQYQKLPVVNINEDWHNNLIYRISKIGKCLNYHIWIGKKEQNYSFNNENFSEISLSTFPIKNLKENQFKKISQIDCIWFNKDSEPQYAFEVEESTTILSALERFSIFLEVYSKIGGKLIIVAPKRRKLKLQQELTMSTYIGHPLYMENKIMYLYIEDLIKWYSLQTKNYLPIKEEELVSLFRSPIKNF